MEAKGKISFWDTGADGLGRLRALQTCAQKWRHELEIAPDAATLAAQLRCRWNFWREARGAKSPLAIKLELAFSFFCLAAALLFLGEATIGVFVGDASHFLFDYFLTLALILTLVYYGDKRLLIFSFFCLAAALLFLVKATIGVFAADASYSLFDYFFTLALILAVVYYGDKHFSEKDREMEARVFSLLFALFFYMAALLGVFYFAWLFIATGSISAGVYVLCVLSFIYFYAGGLCQAFGYMLFLKAIKPFYYLVCELAVLLGIVFAFSYSV